jgi:hypothetical protein
MNKFLEWIFHIAFALGLVLGVVAFYVLIVMIKFLTEISA